jgi:hypothetical protein
MQRVEFLSPEKVPTNYKKAGGARLRSSISYNSKPYEKRTQRARPRGAESQIP